MSVDLPDVGEPDERHVGQQLELEAQPALLALLALLGERRRPSPVGQEPGVAPPAPPALGGQVAVAGVDQVGQHLAVLGTDDGPRRAPGPRRPRRVRPWRPLPLPWVPSVARRNGWSRKASSDATLWSATSQTSPPEPAVAAVGATPGDVRLAPEGDRPGPAVARLGVQVCLVDELGHYRASMTAAARACEPVAGRIRAAGYGRAHRAEPATHEGVTMDIDWVDDIGVVRIDRGVNAFDSTFVDELHAAFDVVAANEDARGLVTVGRREALLERLRHRLPRHAGRRRPRRVHGPDAAPAHPPAHVPGADGGGAQRPRLRHRGDAGPGPRPAGDAPRPGLVLPPRDRPGHAVPSADARPGHPPPGRPGRRGGDPLRPPLRRAPPRSRRASPTRSPTLDDLVARGRGAGRAAHRQGPRHRGGAQVAAPRPGPRPPARPERACPRRRQARRCPRRSGGIGELVRSVSRRAGCRRACGPCARRT